MEECVFCKIAKKEMKASLVFENENFIAFLDKSPIFKGHTLLIPKKHIETLFDFSEDYLKELAVETKRIAEGVKKGMSCDGILLINNNIVSQSVPHFHVHIIPRDKGRPLRGFMWPRTKYKDENEEEDFRKRIANAIEKL
ncbi:HIT domain-containing protein [Candidatus Parvarchaeota archaeon]|nr:HIT domain-containing protein [Candidatus Parvarchaeota archaeon]